MEPVWYWGHDLMIFSIPEKPACITQSGWYFCVETYCYELWECVEGVFYRKGIVSVELQSEALCLLMSELEHGIL